jgi:DNA repair protein RecN (Recombination protein N)
MLLRLRVQDLALIDEVELALEPGFNVFTGETGAGKSILIDSIALLLGRRARPDDVRTGTKAAYVDGVFTMPPDHGLKPKLEAYGIEPDDNLLISREVVAGDPARSVARVNGRAVPMRALAELGPHLIDMHGQTEHQSLLRSVQQLEHLDRYGAHVKQRLDVGRLVDRLRAIRSEEAELRTNARETARQNDLLAFQLNEIDHARLSAQEDEALRAEQQVLANAERIHELAGVSERLLAGDNSVSAADSLGETLAYLSEIVALDPSIKPLADQVAEAQALTSEAAQAVASYAADVESDPARLAEIDARLDAIDALRRKYGDSISEILVFADEARGRLQQLGDSDERLRTLSKEAVGVESGLSRSAGDLRERRLAAADRLALAIADELDDLNLPDAVFNMPLSTHPDEEGITIDGVNGSVAFGRYGVDVGEFHLSVNRGQPPKPLATVASGGEMSRILLGLKSVLAAVDKTPTLIFDEVDVGVGGRRGDVVGQKLAMLAQEHQVMCVTHLASVAAYADTHFVVEKHDETKGVSTRIRHLGRTDTVKEIAAMGGSRTVAGRRVAQDLLANAKTWRATVAAQGR